MKDPLYLCIHGHFYQPPRENPWIEEIEPQESARPFHDWNERIHHESYLPNARARVLDEKGRIADIVNNFKKISFNFGPTLMAWLEAKHPDTYEHILAADRVSVAEHGGHGNAIAQVYNHMIMPLANRRDKVTQVRWGIEEFRRRFRREPESTWLAETACDEETLEVLAEAGMKYVILEPHQAKAFRKIGEHHWHDVSGGQIDPKRPYRYFLKKSPDRFIDIFFYDGPISKAVGFEDILFDAKKFMNRLESAGSGEASSQLISVATDGETFGHHKPFGDRVLAYLVFVEAPKRGFKVTNFGEFLALAPPENEVQIKEGGTSWSCAHGVKRWAEHCGCRGGGPAEWNQHWRKPLREALDWLRDEMWKVFETEGRRYFKNIEEARDQYIQVILDRSEKNITEFLGRHTTHTLSREERVKALKLLEMQRYAMLMYTSCGWFFSELSGIETVQVIEYAARALQLVQEITPVDLEAEFLTRLENAKSNLPAFKDGKVIYEKFIVPHVLSLENVASFYAIHSLAVEGMDHGDYYGLYCFKIQVLHQRKEAYGELMVNFGHLKVSSRITGEEKELLFIAVHMGLYDFRCSVKAFTNHEELERLEKEFFSDVQSLDMIELMRKIDRFLGQQYYSLRDLPVRERTKIISMLTHEMIEKIDEVHERLYDDNRRMSEIYRSINLPIPEEIRYAVEHTLKRRLEAAVKTLSEQGFNIKKATALQRLLENAKSFDVELKIASIAQFLNGELERRTESLLKKLQPEVVAECVQIQKLAKKMKIELSHARSQEHLFSLIRTWQSEMFSMPAMSPETATLLAQLLTELHISPTEFKLQMNPSPEKN